MIVECRGDRGALAATRALARSGWRVGVASQPGGRLAASSRSVAVRHRVPSPQQELDAFATALRSAVSQEGYEVVLPGSGDAETMALSLLRGELGASVPLPSHDRLLGAFDKLNLTKVAESVGIAVPVTADTSSEALASMRFPAIVKARLHSPLAGAGPSRLEAAICHEPEAAMRHATAIQRGGGAPFVQELVPGELMACIGIADGESSLVARAQQLAQRTWRPDVGVSARARTVPLDPGLWAKIEQLLGKLGWFGLAEIQFILCPRRGPLLIDFNGRFYGSLALACAAGADLPSAWAALATGRPLPSERDAKPGVTYQWLEGDLRRAVVERRGGLGADLAETLRTARPPTVHSVWRLDDPGPAAVAIGHSVWHGLRRRRIREEPQSGALTS